MTESAPGPEPINRNRYDHNDIVRRGSVLLAGGIKFASYRVRSMHPTVSEGWRFSKRQFHLTYLPVTESPDLPDGRKHEVINEARATVVAVMDEDVAFMFAVFRQRAADQEASFPKDETFFLSELPFSDHIRFDAYRRPTDGKLEFQVWSGDLIMGLLDASFAQLFCTMVRQSVDRLTTLEAKESSVPKTTKPATDVGAFVAQLGGDENRQEA